MNISGRTPHEKKQRRIGRVTSTQETDLTKIFVLMIAIAGETDRIDMISRRVKKEDGGVGHNSPVLSRRFFVTQIPT